MSRTALIDADIIVFQAAAVAQTWVPDEEGRILYQIAEYPVAEKFIDDFLAEIADELKASIVCALSDREANWRKDILPSYKSNRSSTIPPILRWEMYRYIEENYQTFIRPSLEGDDVLGILSTAKAAIPGEKVIVSIDKDMRTIPGLILNWNHARHAVNAGVLPSIEDSIYEVSPHQADYFHLCQTLAGDTTDGYAGCPGIGFQTADDILQDLPHITVPEERVVSRGPRKGQVDVRWVKQYGEYTQWETIVSYFEKNDLTEADALVQARVARICRAQDYDFKRKEVRLWHP